MEYAFLSAENMDAYIIYLKRAMQDEPEKMLAERFDEEALRERLEDPFYGNKRSILAMQDGEAVGRIEYHFYGCLQDGYRMAYVDWVYVLREYRRRGIARGLFCEFEKDCVRNRIDQYYLIRATNGEAERFYAGFEGAQMGEEPLLRKNMG
ncbi:MAG: GNAT family N-acetyltransferase [Clostridia bacterium]|nr:GNAT family N-acetyltransferase [Clostridia bacterium]